MEVSWGGRILEGIMSSLRLLVWFKVRNKYVMTFSCPESSLPSTVQFNLTQPNVSTVIKCFLGLLQMQYIHGGTLIQPDLEGERLSPSGGTQGLNIQ